MIALLIASAAAYRRRHLSGSAAFGAGAAVDHACPGAAVTDMLAGARNACARRDWLRQIARVCLAACFLNRATAASSTSSGVLLSSAGLRRIGLWFRCAAGRSCLSLSCSEPLQYSFAVAQLSAPAVRTPQLRRGSGWQCSPAGRTEVATAKRIQAETARDRGRSSIGDSLQWRRAAFASAHDSRSERTFTSSLSCRTIPAVLRISASSRATPMVEAIARSWAFSSP